MYDSSMSSILEVAPLGLVDFFFCFQAEDGIRDLIVTGVQTCALPISRALTTRGIGIDEVEQALARSNVNLPTGTLYGAHQMFNVQATGQLTNAAAFRPLVVAYRNGSPVRLEELGRVIDSVQTDKVASWYNDERAVILAVQRQPGTNTVEVVDAIRTLLPRFRSELPASVNLNVLYDRSVAIRESVHDVEFTLLLSITLSLAAVFIPVLFMGGVVGRLLHEFAVVITVAVLVSGFVSLTLTPMACSRFLRPPGQSHSRLYAVSERFFDGMLHTYDWTLRWVLAHRRTVMGVMLLTFVLTAWLFVAIPKGFIPTEDTGQIFAFTEAAQDISFDAMKEKQRAAAAIVLKQPYIDQIMSSIGASTINVVPNTGRIFMRLKPRDQRPPADKIIEDLRPKLATVPGLKVYPQNLPTIRIGGSLTKALYQYTLQATDLQELYRWAPILYDKMRTLPGFTDVNTDLQIASPQVTVDIDRDKASALGVTAEQIEDALYDAYGSRQVSTIYTPTNQYWVIMELDPKYQRDPAELSLLYVRSQSGKLVPLNSVARLMPTIGPLPVTHLGQLPAVTISFNLQPGVSLSEAVAEVQKVQRELRLPATIVGSFQGTAQAFQASLKGQGLLLVVTILVIYLVLGILYESFIHPLTILSGLPSAGVGALLTLMLFKLELNVYGFVGIIMLVGIVKKNAIMMIDFPLQAERPRPSPAHALYQGCPPRFPAT